MPSGKVIILGQVVKLVDTADLKSAASELAGSTPAPPTTIKATQLKLLASSRFYYTIALVVLVLVLPWFVAIKSAIFFYQETWFVPKSLWYCTSAALVDGEPSCTEYRRKSSGLDSAVARFD